MRRGSREISIFSMSALDLFASALGAFILLAVIMIPYFPNTGDSPQRIADVAAERDAAEDAASSAAARAASAEAEAAQAQAQAAAAQAAADAAQARAAAAEAEAAQLKRDRPSQANSSLPPVDIIVAIDTTGSMDAQVRGLKSDIITLAEILNSVSDSAALGVIDFKDACEGGRALRSAQLRVLTPSAISQLSQFVRPMFAGNYRPECNFDQPEAIDLALRSALGMGWRSNVSNRVIVIASDNAAYPNKRQQTFNDAARFNQAGGKVSAVYVRTGGSEAIARSYMRQLAQAGGGAFVPEGGSFIGAVLIAAFQ